MINILKLLIFTLIINWCISLQILNQSLPKGKEKTIAILLCLVSGVVAALIVRW
jgi:hypothetical protein